MSLVVVALGQPAWINGLTLFASTAGYALFWKQCEWIISPWHKALTGWIWFTLVQIIQLSWMSSITEGREFVIPAYGLLSILLGLQFSLLTIFVSRLSPLVSAAIWTVMEWMRLYFLCGFSWNPVGLSLAGWTTSLQLASVGGIFGLSFWVMATNGFFLQKKWKIGLLFALFPHLFGLCYLSYYEKKVAVSEKLAVALVQTALLPSQKNYISAKKCDFIHPEEQWEQIIQLLARYRPFSVDVVVMPESVVSYKESWRLFDIIRAKSILQQNLGRHFSSPTEAGLRVSHKFWMEAIGQLFQADVIAGLDTEDEGKSYVSSFFYSHQNQQFHRYDKTVLLPFAEYLPFSGMDFFAQILKEENFFSQGCQLKLFSSKVPIATLICYEETFGHLVRKAKNLGAALLVNLTNDNWYPNSRLHQQHFDLIRVHAAAVGIPVVRACNSGITSIINCLGKAVAWVEPHGKSSILIDKVPLYSITTLYARFGNGLIISFACFICLVFTLKRLFHAVFPDLHPFFHINTSSSSPLD